MGAYTMKNDYFECSCSSKEHTFCVTSEDSSDSWPPEMFFHIQLTQPNSFIAKMKVAVKYLLGYQCKYGHWDVVNLQEDDITRLIVLLHQHRAKLSKYNDELANKKQN
jgi:hypothetical protein